MEIARKSRPSGHTWLPFGVWAAEQTNVDRIVAEMCLAHKVGAATEQAYSRSDLLEKRRRVMEHWADYITQHPMPNVIHLNR